MRDERSGNSQWEACPVLVGGALSRSLPVGSTLSGVVLLFRFLLQLLTMQHLTLHSSELLKVVDKVKKVQLQPDFLFSFSSLFLLSAEGD